MDLSTLRESLGAPEYTMILETFYENQQMKHEIEGLKRELRRTNEEFREFVKDSFEYSEFRMECERADRETIGTLENKVRILSL